MSKTTIAFENHERIRLLLGPKDKYIRLIRDAVGIDVVLRGDELHIHGDEAAVDQARQIFEQLNGIVEMMRGLPEKEVHRVLEQYGVLPSNLAGQTGQIELNDRAKNVKPRTPGQARYIRAIRDNDLVFCSGPAGCGKTYLAVAMALNAMRTEEVRKIVLVRPAVEAGEKLGFLPGDMLAKVNPFLRPLLDALNDMLNFEAVNRYMENDVVEVVPLAFMRGRTLNDTFIILDEGQNTTITQMKMFLTRMGVNSKIVVTGDITQVDLERHVQSGLTDAIRRLGSIDGVAAVQLTGQDIVRHRLVREIVTAYDDTDQSQSSSKDNTEGSDHSKN